MRGAIHVALMRGDYATYKTANPGGATAEEFAAAAAAFLLIESTLLACPMADFLRDRVIRIGAIATGTDEYDDRIALVARWCASLLAVRSESIEAVCTNVRERLAEIGPEFRRVSIAEMQRLVRAERRKRIPGASSLAAALWTAAGLRGARGRAVDNKAVSAAAARSRASRSRGSARG